MYVCHWSDEIVDHLAEHGVSPEEFEEVINDPVTEFSSDSSGLPMAVGWQGDRWLYCVFKFQTEIDVEPVTAYFIEDR